jgi:ferritin-like protein
MASEGLHESAEDVTPFTRDLHRAIVSLMEELEAIDWYQQRVDAATDPDLKAILAHNRDEEKEHAVMVLEWIRRRDAVFDEQLRRYLFTTAPITAQEEGAGAPQAGKAASTETRPAGAAATIGSLKGGR